MTLEEVSRLRHYAVNVRDLVSREERLRTERSALPSWNDTKCLLLTWADELEQEAREAGRRSKH